MSGSAASWSSAIGRDSHVTALLQRRLRPATAAPFRQLLADTGSDVAETTAALAAGKIGLDEWHGILLETLAEAHAQAGYLGRLRAGDRAAFDDDDTRFGRLVAQEEMPFLDGFRDDLAAGRYGTPELVPGLDLNAIQRRAAMYVTRLSGTANEALALVADEEIEWLLGETEATCIDCMRLATGSPYQVGTLPTYPRSGGTRCLSNCMCEIRTASGLEGFRP